MAKSPDQNALPVSIPQPAGGIARYNAVDEGAMLAPGQAVARAGATMEEFGNNFHLRLKHEQEKADTLRAEEAFTKLRQKQLDLTTGEGGFVNQKGANAVTKPILKDYTGQFDMAVQQAGSDLQTDEQRALFTRRANVASLEFKGDILKHVVSQGSVYGKEVYDGIVNLETRNATARWDNPEAIAISLGRIGAAVKQRAESEGWPKQYADAMVLQDASKIHEAVISQALATGDYKYAQAWYKQNVDQIDRTTAVALDKAVRDGTQKQLAAGYNNAYLAVRDDAKGLAELEKAVVKDGTLDETRKNTIRSQILSRIDTVDRRQTMQYTQWEKQVERDVAKIKGIALAGFEPTMEQISPLIGMTRGTPMQAEVDELVNTMTMARQFRLMPPAQQEQELTRMTVAARSGEGVKNNLSTFQALVKSIRGIESGGTADPAAAVSPQGASGSMQIMPDTFKQYAKPGESYDNETDRVNAALRKIQDDFNFYNGDVTKTAAAYIGGRGAVRADGTIRDDVKDALGTTPAAYAAKVAKAVSGADAMKFDVSMIQRFRQIHDAQKTALREDSITFAVRQGLVKADDPAVAPIDLSKPDTLQPGSLQARISLARGMNRQYGAPVKPLTTEEVALATTALRNANPEGKANLFAKIAQGSGNDMHGYKAVMAQLAPDDPVTAAAGVHAGRAHLVTDVGVKLEPQQARRVSELILAGQALLQPNRKEDGKPTGGKLVTMPADTKFDKQFDSAANTTFAGAPETRNAFLQTTKAIYAKLTSDAGNQDGDGIDDRRFDTAMKLATGGIDKYRGRYITMPWGHDFGQFQDGLYKRIDDLERRGSLPENVVASHLKDLPLENVGDNKYVFRSGDARLADRNGRPIVIDFDQNPIQPVTTTAAVVRGDIKMPVKPMKQPWDIRKVAQ